MYCSLHYPQLNPCLLGCSAGLLPCRVCVLLSPCCQGHLQITTFYPVLPAFSRPYSPESHLCHPYYFVDSLLSPRSERAITLHIHVRLPSQVYLAPHLRPGHWHFHLISYLITHSFIYLQHPEGCPQIIFT